MRMIPLEEAVFLPISFADPNGRILEWQGELYRAFRASSAPLYRRLFADGVIQSLVGKGLLVDTDATPLSLDGYEMVIRHRRIPFVSYACEWSPPMLKDAALLTLDLNLELAASGLATQDAHPWNILFDGPRPTFIDLGSIAPLGEAGDSWRSAYEQFCSFFLYPLYLMAVGQGRIARALLQDFDGGVSNEELLAFRPGGFGTRVPLARRLKTRAAAWRRVLAPRIPPALRDRLRPLASGAGGTGVEGRRAHVRILRGLQREVERITFPERISEWSAYEGASRLTLEPAASWTAKQHSVWRVLEQLRPERVLDAGSNQGWYSRLAAVHGAKVAACDIDELCAARLYRRARQERLTILPLIMNIRNPAPAYGGGAGRWYPGATERLQADLVMALALVHHLVFKQNLRWEQLAEVLGAFARRWLLVEFIDAGDPHIRSWSPERFPWYTCEQLIETLRKRFPRIERLPSNDPTRTLLLCDREP